MVRIDAYLKVIFSFIFFNYYAFLMAPLQKWSLFVFSLVRTCFQLGLIENVNNLAFSMSLKTSSYLELPISRMARKKNLHCQPSDRMHFHRKEDVSIRFCEDPASGKSSHTQHVENLSSLLPETIKFILNY